MDAPVRAMNADRFEGARRAWYYAIAVAIACFLGVGIIFWQETLGAIRVWNDSETYNHCYLIIPIALYMIWQRRGGLADLVPAPEFRAIPAVALLSLGWLAVSMLGILEAQQFAVMTIVQAVLFGVLGRRVYWHLRAPFLYLYFLVPSGAVLVPALQDFTADFAVTGLQLLGVPVFSDGATIEVPSATFIVAEACAGLRFLIAAVAFGVFYATEIFDSSRRRVIFIALCVVVPIIANGFRALGIIVASEIVGSAAAVMADHVTYGWVFFSMVLVALIFIGRSFSDRGPADTHRGTGAAPIVPSSRLRQLAAAGLLLAATAGLGPAFANILDAPGATVMPAAGPSMASSWRQVQDAPADWRPTVIRADGQFLDEFTDGQDQVVRFAALYAPHGRTSQLIRSENRLADENPWHYNSGGRTTVRLRGRDVPVTVTEIVAGNRKRLVWSFYALDGVITANALEAKWHDVRRYLTGSGCLSAFVAIAASADADAAHARQVLARYLSDMAPLQPYLCAASGRG